MAARKLTEIGDKPCPAQECAISDAVAKANRILEKIDERWTLVTVSAIIPHWREPED